MGYTHVGAVLGYRGWFRTQRATERSQAEVAGTSTMSSQTCLPPVLSCLPFRILLLYYSMERVLLFLGIHQVRFPYMTTRSFTFVISRNNVIGMPKQRRKCNNVVVKREHFQHTFYITSYDIIPLAGSTIYSHVWSKGILEGIFLLGETTWFPVSSAKGVGKNKLPIISVIINCSSNATYLLKFVIYVSVHSFVPLHSSGCFHSLLSCWPSPSVLSHRWKQAAQEP